MPKASELGPGERELTFLKRELNKEIKSLLSQPESFNLPGYSSLHEPHRTIDFLAKHHLYPALQSVVSQAVDKLTGALCHDGCPLFPSERKPSTEPNSGFKQAPPTKGEEPYDLPTTATPGFKMVGRKNKSRVRGKLKDGGFPMSSAQGVTRFRLQVIPTEEPKVPSPYPRQEAPDQDPKEQTPLMFSSGPQSSSQKAQPWRSLHLTLPAPGIKVEVPSQTHLTQVRAPHASPCCLSSCHLPVFSPLTSLLRNLSPSLTSLYPETISSRVGLEDIGASLQGNVPFRHHS